MAQTLGIIDIVWRGRKLAVERGASFRPGGIQQNPVVYGREVGHSGEFIPSMVTATIPLVRGRRLADIVTAGQGELQVLCDTGHIYVMSDAFISNRPEATGGEGGKVEIEWTAGPAEELLDG